MQVASSRAQLRAGASACRRVSRARVTVVKAAKTADGPRIAIVGVTGAVGQEFLTVSACQLLCQSVAATQAPNKCLSRLQVLQERNFPYSNIKMLASGRCAGAARWPVLAAAQVLTEAQ